MRNPGRDMNTMTPDEKLNHTYWELAFALGWVMAGDKVIEANLNEVLAESTKLIELGHNYRDLCK